MHLGARCSLAGKSLDIPFGSERHAGQAAAEAFQTIEAVATGKVNGREKRNPVPEEIQTRFKLMLAGAVGNSVGPFQAMESNLSRTGRITSNAEHQLPALENVGFRVGTIGPAEQVISRVAGAGDINPGRGERGSKLYHQSVSGHLRSASVLVGDLWTCSLHPLTVETLAIPAACEHMVRGEVPVTFCEEEILIKGA